MKPIYLDYNATTPLLPEVAAAMQPYLTGNFGNPSSAHAYGLQARQAVERARQQVAGFLGCAGDEIIFTSGGSESNNLAIKGIALAAGTRGNHLITSVIEHPAVEEVCRYLESRNFEVTRVAVDSYGRVDPDDVRKAIKTTTILITIMHANNEVGTIQPLREIADLAHRHDILMHTDAAQSAGKIPVSIPELGVDLLSLAGHKLYAPKGIGVLYLRRGIRLEKLIHGAGHEHDLRAGTENVLEIVGLGQACEIAARDLPAIMDILKARRDQLNDGLRSELKGKVLFRINGHPEYRLPNTLNISFAGIEANLLLSEIGDHVAASAGAACHSDRIEISGTLQAMQVPVEYAMGTIRFSTGRMTSTREIEETVQLVGSAVKKLQPAEVIPDRSGQPTAAIPGLTHFTQGLGCACKLRPQVLQKILQHLPVPQDKRVLVGTETSDDAAVFQIDSQTAIVQTVDFFTPIVDDPFDFGRIAASNALSDIYAMGAQPLLALNLVGFPSQRLPLEILEKILQGAQQVAAEAGIAILGGHTIEDNEPKYGLAVCGIVDPGKIWRNRGAQAGDALILTKPLGSGIMTTALKKGLLDLQKCREVTEIMAGLNNTAAQVMKQYRVHACTDVTGFGLLGHLLEMSTASRMDLRIKSSSVPLISGVGEFADLGMIPGGTKNNLEFAGERVHWSPAIRESMKFILADAQTSGGLLAAVPAADAQNVLSDLQQAGITTAAIIGEFDQGGAGQIKVV